MRAGALDRRIRIERMVKGKDELNNETTGWEPVATVWASAEPVRDSERMAAAEKGAEISMRFQIRYSSTVATVNPKDRIVYPTTAGRTYDIVAVKEIGRREGLEISAVARAD